MGWQKCPVCEGKPVDCRPCGGQGIIDECTGRPPGTGPVMCETTKKAAEPLPNVDKLDDKAVEEVFKPMSVLDEYSDEEILYYASPYFDELQRQKELRAEQLTDQEEK